MDLQERVVGCVLGLAMGDALGAPFEFLRAANVPDPAPALELPWMHLPPGSTTDDTAMARNLVRSLGDRGGFDEDDLARRHLDWFATRSPGVGSLTRRVLSRADRGTPVSEAAREVWEQRGPEVSAGNGSVMYCVPLGLALANEPGRLAELAPRLSAITHYDERCRTAVLAVTAAAAALARGDDRETSVAAGLEAALPRPGGEELEFLVEAVGGTRPVDGPDMGFCLFAAAVGLQAVLRHEGFEEGVRAVVALGGDTDTNAAVAGGLLGTLVGREGLPETWLGRLLERESIEREAEALARVAAEAPGSPPGPD